MTLYQPMQTEAKYRPPRTTPNLLSYNLQRWGTAFCIFNKDTIVSEILLILHNSHFQLHPFFSCQQELNFYASSNFLITLKSFAEREKIWWHKTINLQILNCSCLRTVPTKEKIVQQHTGLQNTQRNKNNQSTKYCNFLGNY